ncbi:hypothetical protein [Haloarchaeobius iranensis]|uniref:hypothetical protein n=1 Tax=Haloarchaeobius iranensis TaxID=996166 RepID=UPI001113558D|nr:hypothetical protein [Haloarchaeobius iranensis]
MKRRAVLGSLLASLSGCSSLTNQQSGSKQKINVVVRNYHPEPVTMTVFFTDEQGETMFSRRYQLGGGGYTNEEHEFRGRPERVYVVTTESKVNIKNIAVSCPTSSEVNYGVAQLENGNIQSGYTCSEYRKFSEVEGGTHAPVGSTEAT